jgi:hypothetical protein
MKFIRIWLILCAAMLLAWQAVAVSSEQIKLTIGSWGFEQKQAENLDIQLLLTDAGLGIKATADVLMLEEPIGQLEKVSLSCDVLQLNSQQYSCLRGGLAFSHAKLGSQKIQFSLKANPEKTSYIISINDLNLAETDFSLQLELLKDEWQIDLDSPQASLNNMMILLSPYISIENNEVLGEWSYESNLTIKAELFGKDKKLKNGKIHIAVSGLNLSDQQGLFVTEDTAMLLNLNIHKIDQDWQWQADIKVNKGQAYGEPIFLDFSESILSFNGTGLWQQEQNKLSIEQARVQQQGILDVSFELESDLQQIQHLELITNKADLQKIYPILLQPFLAGSAVANLELSGMTSVKLNMQEDKYQFITNLENVFIDDNEGKFGFYDLNGQLAWTNTSEPLPLQLSWQGAYVYAVQLGFSELIAETKLSQLDIQETWNIPIFDGELQLNDFSLKHLDEQTQWTFNGLLTPISMESLSSALEWPTLHGKLSGVIPEVSYKEQYVQVDGALMLKLFGGTTVIRNLQLEQAFGSLPQLYANVDISNLDLETLTKTFDFGKITGRLDGQVHDLRLSNWQPVQFDAKFHTPEMDKSRHRISQKAVDNLSQIGGGASGVLSRSFLRFFEDFSYKELGLNCMLLNDICEMSGVGEAEQGYYIVKGGGLPPRINVVGYTRRVDWPDLIERLENVSRSSGPVIQ